MNKLIESLKKVHGRPDRYEFTLQMDFNHDAQTALAEDFQFYDPRTRVYYRQVKCSTKVEAKRILIRFDKLIHNNLFNCRAVYVSGQSFEYTNHMVTVSDAEGKFLRTEKRNYSGWNYFLDVNIKLNVR